MDIAEKAAAETASAFTTSLIAAMIEADEDPGDNTLWRKRKAAALAALQLRLAKIALGR